MNAIYFLSLPYNIYISINNLLFIKHLNIHKNVSIFPTFYKLVKVIAQRE